MQRKNTPVLVHLNSARAHFDEMRVLEAYRIFFRCFSQMSLRWSPCYADFVGSFVTTVAGLDRRGELAFYVRQLEIHRDLPSCSAMQYTLAFFEQSLPSPCWEASRERLESILRTSNSANIRNRAAILLARYYESVGEDLAACRSLIFSVIRDPEPRELEIVRIWKALILRREGRNDEASAILGGIIERKSSVHWYLYFSAAVVQANILITSGRNLSARRLIAEVRSTFRGPHFRIIDKQMQVLEKLLRESFPDKSEKRKLASRPEKDPAAAYRKRRLLRWTTTRLREERLVDPATPVRNLL